MVLVQKFCFENEERLTNSSMDDGYTLYLILLLRENYPRLHKTRKYATSLARLTRSKSAPKLSSFYSFHAYKSGRKISLSTFQVEQPHFFISVEMDYSKSDLIKKKDQRNQK